MGVAGIIITLLLLGLGIFIRYKNATWLISGYKTASEEERAGHDIKKLGRRTSALLYMLSAITSIMTVLGYIFGNYLNKIIIVGIFVCFLAIVAGIVYINSSKT